MHKQYFLYDHSGELVFITWAFSEDEALRNAGKNYPNSPGWGNIPPEKIKTIKIKKHPL